MSSKFLGQLLVTTISVIIGMSIGVGVVVSLGRCSDSPLQCTGNTYIRPKQGVMWAYKYFALCYMELYDFCYNPIIDANNHKI